jgi:outer membrane protein OmpA-like peptidoglycan-associated protein
MSPENERRGKSRKGFFIGLAVSVVVVILGGYWLLDFLKQPEIRLDETSVEVPSGRELPALSIWVKNGVLTGNDDGLPPGVEIVEGEETAGEREYLLTGSPRKAGNYEITFTAERENNPARKSPPATFELIVTEVKLEWQKDGKGGLALNSVGLVEKKPLPTNSISTVVTGAKALSLEWQGSPLQGVSVVRVPNTETSWQLSGTPQSPGNFRAIFMATKATGETESQTFELVVGAIPPPPPPPPPSPALQPDPAMPVAKDDGTAKKPADDRVVAGPPAKDAIAIIQPPPVPEPDPKADEKMRGFLLERIEKANSHFSDEEKAQLRMVVNTLKEAHLIGTVHFKSNSSEISRFEKEKLVNSLEEPALKKLLEDEDCQILIVGYADKTGKLSHNIKLSKLRAREVDLLLKKQTGRRADLCGDYGPTDLISENAADNRVVEVYAGTIEISGLLETVADKFKEDFNKRHGLR